MRVGLASGLNHDKYTCTHVQSTCVPYMYMYLYMYMYCTCTCTCVHVASYTVHMYIACVSVIYTYMYYSVVDYFVTAGRAWCMLGGSTHAQEKSES